MKLVIDLPEEIHERVKDGYVPLGISKYLKNGTPYEERPHGKWVGYKEGNWFLWAKCPLCQWDSGEAFEYAIDRFSFCPNCGADMRKEGEEE